MREQFRGINMYLEGVSALKAMPDEMQGANPKDFALDRWLPVDDNDRIATTMLPEIQAEWITVIDDQIFYGLERWGEMIPENYTEYFAVIVIRPWVFSSSYALRVCSELNFFGPSRFIIP